MTDIRTLGNYIAAKEKSFPGGELKFSSVMASVRLAAKIVSNEVNKAGITEDIIGSMGKENVQGEIQQKLDVFADKHFVTAMRFNGGVAGVGSEEHEEIIQFDEEDSKDVVQESFIKICLQLHP